MKRIWIAVIALALIAASAAQAFAAEDPAQRFCGRWQDPYYGRAMLKITPGDAEAPEGERLYDAELAWGSSARSEGVWRMTAAYDAAADALVYEGGEMAEVTYGEDGGVVAEEVRWTDAEGTFTLSDGALRWSDSREARAAEFAFEPVPKLAPDAEALVDRYFVPVAEWQPGTAGSSLKLAALAADVAGFADEYTLWDADVPALRANLLDAWTALDDSTRRRFDEDLPDVASLLDEAFADYASVAGQFDDAGAAYMSWLAKDDGTRRSWQALLNYTLTMGDGE